MSAAVNESTTLTSGRSNFVIGAGLSIPIYTDEFGGTGSQAARLTSFKLNRRPIAQH
jgi:hypothetical protein